MSETAGEMQGVKLKIFKFRFCINQRGIDVSNGMKGTFLFHPWSKHFSIKQYYSSYKWIFTEATSFPKSEQ